MKHIAVLGANGHLGNEVLHAFHAAGYQVTAITRNGQLRKAPPGVKRAAADALNLPQLKKTVRGADFIFNGLKLPYTSLPQQALPLARNVMEAARSTAAVLLCAGSVYNYGNTIPPLCDENTPMSAKSIKGKIGIETEKLFALAAQKYRLQTLLIRAGDFYGGCGRGTWFDLALVNKLEQGRFVYPGPMEVTHAWAYVPDLAQVFVAVANNQQHYSGFENLLFRGHNFTGSELKGLVENACGAELQLLTMPWKLIRAGSLLVPVWRDLAETAYLWARPHRLAGERLDAVLAGIAQTVPDVAVRDTLQRLGKL